MARVLGPEGPVRLVAPGGGEELGDGDVALLLLEGLEIRRLFASDGRRPRTKEAPDARPNDVEGLLAFRVSGQESVAPWSARVREARDGTRRYDLREPERLRGRLLFAGEAAGLLDLEASLVESDAESREELRRAERVAELAAALARALPGPGTAVGGALSLFAALLSFARRTSRDDLELRLFASLGDVLGAGPATGAWRIERRSGGLPELAIAMRLHRVVPGAARHGVVVLDAIELDLPAEREREELVFEAAVGAGRFARRLAFAEALANAARGGLESVLGIGGALLYAGPLAAPVPFRFLAATVRDRERARALADVAAAGARAAVPLLDAEGRRAAGAAAKALDSALSVVVDLLPEKGFDARAEGVLGTGAGEAAAAALGDRLILLGGDLAGFERRTLTLADPSGGTVRLRLRIGPAPGPTRSRRAAAPRTPRGRQGATSTGKALPAARRDGRRGARERRGGPPPGGAGKVQ